MLLADVRLGMELDLLRVSGLTGEASGIIMPSAGLRGQSPQLVAREDTGKPAAADNEWLRQMKSAAATRSAWRVESIYQTYGSIAVVHIAGVIDKHITDSDMSCYGGCDLADVDRALAKAGADPKIQRVVLNINSPGGSVLGVAETAARVAKLRETKEVHQFVDGLCCSAAEYIGSQADIRVTAPSARSGSIGVYLAVLDATRQAEMEGLKVEIIKAGKWKALGSPFQPLTEEQRTYLQAQVDDMHTQFKAAVADGRKRAGKTVDAANMEAQVFTGKQAVEVGLFDALTNLNLDEYVASLL